MYCSFLLLIGRLCTCEKLKLADKISSAEVSAGLVHSIVIFEAILYGGVVLDYIMKKIQ